MSRKGAATKREGRPRRLYRSAAAQIAWPAVLQGEAAAALGILHQLEESQWWSPDALLAQQLRQFDRLFSYARRAVPYYRARFAEIEWPDRPSATLADFRRLPILTREAAQEAGEDLETEALPKGHAPTSTLFTSGTTGRPLKSRTCRLARLFWRAFTLRDHVWQDRDFSAKWGAIRDFDAPRAKTRAGLRSATWGGEMAGLLRTGPGVGLSITVPVADQLAWLQREKPAYLITYPSTARALALRCRATGEGLSSLREIITLSEILQPDTRQLCEEVFQVGLVDLYTTRESGYLALQCPEEQALHLQSEGVLVEVLDDSGAPCAPGQTGRVIVTPLHNFAKPLIRFQTGDAAVAGGPCPCGRGLPVIERIIGRERHRVVLPDGSRRWPALLGGEARHLVEIAPVREYQFIQRDPRRMVARLAVGRPLTAAEEDQVASWIAGVFRHPSLAVDFEYHDTLPRSAAGKLDEFICEIDED